MAFESKPMVKKLNPLKSVLEPKEGPESEAPEMENEEAGEEGYDTYQQELKDILGLDDEKAARLKEAICGMMESRGLEEMGEGDEEKKPEPGPNGKKKGLAIILGS